MCKFRNLVNLKKCLHAFLIWNLFFFNFDNFLPSVFNGRKKIDFIFNF